MLHLFIFVITSPASHPPIFPSIMAISNIDEFTPNYLLQQVYGTKVVDEDIDVGLSDKELELIAGVPEEVDSYDSDLILNRRLIMRYPEFQQFMNSHPDGWQQIAYIQDKLERNGINITQQVAGVIWNNLRATAPILIKRAHRGFRINLNTGQLVYFH